jgi:hypothetical protein
MGEKRYSYRILVEKPKGKSPLGRTRRRWEANVRMDLREIRWRAMDWIELAEDGKQWRELVETVMIIQVS